MGLSPENLPYTTTTTPLGRIVRTRKQISPPQWLWLIVTVFLQLGQPFPVTLTLTLQYTNGSDRCGSSIDYFLFLFYAESTRPERFEVRGKCSFKSCELPYKTNHPPKPTPCPASGRIKRRWFCIICDTHFFFDTIDACYDAYLRALSKRCCQLKPTRRRRRRRPARKFRDTILALFIPFLLFIFTVAVASLVTRSHAIINPGARDRTVAQEGTLFPSSQVNDPMSNPRPGMYCMDYRLRSDDCSARRTSPSREHRRR